MQSVEKDGNTQGFCLHVRDLQQKHLDSQAPASASIWAWIRRNSFNSSNLASLLLFGRDTRDTWMTVDVLDVLHIRFEAGAFTLHSGMHGFDSRFRDLVRFCHTRNGNRTPECCLRAGPDSPEINKIDHKNDTGWPGTGSVKKI